MKIYVSDFVKRQTKESEFSYYDGTFQKLEQLTNQIANSKTVKIKNGYRDDVKLIELDGTPNFYSSVVPMSEDIDFEIIHVARKEGEEKISKRQAIGDKVLAPYIDIVIYNKSALIEDEDYVAKNEKDYWEIVSINCRLTKEEHPIPPSTMMRNQLAGKEGGKGGTKANYTGDEFAKSIRFWNNHIMVKPRFVELTKPKDSKLKYWYIVFEGRDLKGNLTRSGTNIYSNEFLDIFNIHKSISKMMDETIILTNIIELTEKEYTTYSDNNKKNSSL